MSKNKEFRPAIVIPCYRHASSLKSFLNQILNYGYHVIIVDDGNEPSQANILQELASLERVSIVVNKTNEGKGAAFLLGVSFASEHGFTHVLQIDADGQHDINSIPRFMHQASINPNKLIYGSPVYNNVPKGRYLARFITHFWVAVELGKMQIIDTMCGLRVYPIKPVLEIANVRSIGKRMDFDTEIFIRMYWYGVDYISEPISVSYIENGVSNFAPFRDNVLISIMHTKLCCEKVLHFWSIHNRSYL
jgi:glycosyltransferase involved in cell wall biosynthesis